MEEELTYKNNYLTDVIFRIDFSSVLEIEANGPQAGFEEAIKEKFPTKEPTQNIIFLKMERKEGGLKAEEGVEKFWRYNNTDSTISIEVKSNDLVVLAKKYTNYTSFKNTISEVLSFFLKFHKIEKVNRIGLRYINKFTMEKKEDLFNWKDYLDSNLVCGIDFIEDKKNLKRSIQVYEITPQEDVILSIKSGIFNSWYPNNLLSKEFFLDMDCSTQVAFPTDQIIDKSDRFNKIISEYFEKSITSKLRDILNK